VRVLLDTHVLLWWLEGSAQLPGSARALIADPENTIFVSAVSMWEIWLKQSLGKLRLSDGFEDALAAESFENLPLSAAHAREVARLPWLHRDPFDRMLLAQARVAGLRLLTSDEALAAYSEPVLLAR
jgi:PIN domain nuclease of toxin-antitoxin system